MEVIQASVLGFCFGVRRAVELVEKALAENPLKKVYSLGPLIHNESFLKTLEQKGLNILDEKDISKVKEDSIIIIRAHGVSPAVIKELEKRNCSVIDATCPRVKASQKMVERFTNQNDFVVMSGDKNHGEMIGIAGFAGKNFKQIQNAQEAEKLQIPSDLNVILMSQTTYSEKEFSKIEQILKAKIQKIDVMNTICPATKERQDALKELCGVVDGVLVIGGKSSANTKRLFQTAQENCKYTAYIQSSEDIPEIFYGLNRVGVTAGASTPDDIIFSVKQALKKD